MKIYALYDSTTSKTFYFKTKKKAKNAAIEIYRQNNDLEELSKEEIKSLISDLFDLYPVTVK